MNPFIELKIFKDGSNYREHKILLNTHQILFIEEETESEQKYYWRAIVHLNNKTISMSWDSYLTLKNFLNNQVIGMEG